MLEAKLAKDSKSLFVEAILANMVVNIAFMMATQAGQDFSAKLLGIIVVIPAFAAMSYEHSIANFVMVQLGGFVYGPRPSTGSPSPISCGTGPWCGWATWSAAA